MIESQDNSRTLSFQPVTLSILAMATRFEIVLCGDEFDRLRAAGEEALEEIEALDRQLSRFRGGSDISRINATAAREPVKVEPGLFHLLELARDISERTNGAFDITIGSLMNVWGFEYDSGHIPDPSDLEAARTIIGMKYVRLNEYDFTVSFEHAGIIIDLGAIGKGYAIERAVEVLKNAGVTSALLHGGTSTVYGLGAPPGQRAWRIAVKNPKGSNELIDDIELMDNSLSVSAIHGKSFIDGGHEYGHIIDPGTGQPSSHTRLAAVSGPSPTITDALSTALLVLGKEEYKALMSEFIGYSEIIINN